MVESVKHHNYTIKQIQVIRHHGAWGAWHLLTAQRAAATVGVCMETHRKTHLIATCNTKSLVFESLLKPTNPRIEQVEEISKCWIKKWRILIVAIVAIELHKFRPCTWVKHQKPTPLPELHEAPEWHLDIVVAVCCGCTWGCKMNGLTPSKHGR